MKRIFLLTFSFLWVSSVFSQLKYDKGYFIDKDGTRTECLIKFLDWKNSPDDFEYKLSAGDQTLEIAISEVQEFGVYDLAKYKWINVKIDRSSDNVENLSRDREPDFKLEEVLVKVLVEGSVSLYEHKEKTFLRFFIHKDDSEIEQLVYKRYVQETRNILANETYKQQLMENAFCGSLSFNEMQNLTYKQKPLLKHFNMYYACTGEDYTYYGPSSQRERFNLHIRPGLSFNSMKLTNATSVYKTEGFTGSLGLRIGIEAEFVLPFNKNKWSILFEPVFQYHENDNISGPRKVELLNKSYSVSFGLRYFYMNRNSFRLYGGINGIVDFPVNPGITFDNGYVIEAVESLRFPSLNFGARIKNKLSVELRYWPLAYAFDENDFQANYRALYIVLGYTIL